MAIMEVAISVTDTEVFEQVLWLLCDAYQSTSDDALKRKIRKDLKKILAGRIDVEQLLSEQQ